MGVPQDTLDDIREALTRGKVRWRLHAQERMIERGIYREDVIGALRNGEVLEEYADTRPFPSFLVHQQKSTKALHVVLAWDKLDKVVYIITAYEPSLEHFLPDFRTRRVKSNG